MWRCLPAVRSRFDTIIGTFVRLFSSRMKLCCERTDDASKSVPTISVPTHQHLLSLFPDNWSFPWKVNIKAIGLFSKVIKPNQKSFLISKTKKKQIKIFNTSQSWRNLVKDDFHSSCDWPEASIKSCQLVWTFSYAGYAVKIMEIVSLTASPCVNINPARAALTKELLKLIQHLTRLCFTSFQSFQTHRFTTSHVSNTVVL